MKRTAQSTAKVLTKERFADGTLSGEGRYQNGQRQGKWRFLYRSGQLKAIGKYVGGLLDGRWTWWREDGVLLQSGAFRLGAQVGPWKRYHANGQLLDSGHYAAGKKVGEWIAYDASGAVKQRKVFGAATNSRAGGRPKTRAGATRSSSRKSPARKPSASGRASGGRAAEDDGALRVDAYIARFPPDVQQRLSSVRATVINAAPDARQTISYQMPTLTLHGNLVHFAAFKQHLGFYPTPSGTRRFQQEIARYKSGRGSIQFPHDEPLPLGLIARIVKFRVQENRARVKAKSPAGRRKPRL